MEDKVAESVAVDQHLAWITELEKQLTAKSEDIVQAQEDLEAAQAQEAKQYEYEGAHPVHVRKSAELIQGVRLPAILQNF